LLSGVVAALVARGGARANHKPGHCPPTGGCTDYLVCDINRAHCDRGCSCVLTLEGCHACTEEIGCGPACTSSAECEGLAEFGPGAVCQAPETGCCGQTCLRPCPRDLDAGNRVPSGTSNIALE
jgi:hypothetical protein